MPESANAHKNGGPKGEINYWIGQSPGKDAAGKAEPAASPSQYGRFCVQEDCVADHNGIRHTITFHHPLPFDDLYAATPKAETAVRPRSNPPERYPIPQECDRCVSARRAVYFQMPDVKAKLSAQYKALMNEYEIQGLHGMRPEVVANRLKIEGHTYAFNRGKEINLYIANDVTQTYWLIRVHFHTEGHTFGCPTAQYEDIISIPPVIRPNAAKCKAFVVPPKYHPKGLEDREFLVSIIAAIVRPHRTQLFVDHNCLITFHIHRLRHPLTAYDMTPGSPTFRRLWGLWHGPTFPQELGATYRALEFWRRSEIRKPHNKTRTIFMALTQAQHACNGFGAQEGTDALVWGFIPAMQPAREVFKDDDLWRRLCQALHDRALAIKKFIDTQQLPRLSRNDPYYFNESGHKRYMPNILAYKRDHFSADRDWLAQAVAFGLIIRLYKMRPNGTATAPALGEKFKPIARAMPDQPLEVQNKSLTVQLAMYAVKVGGKRHWTPFIAAPADTWATYEEVFHPNFDISHVKRDSTLGPYSYVTFCQAAHAHRASEEPAKARIGRPPKTKAGKGLRKAPITTVLSPSQHSRLYKTLYVKDGKEVDAKEEEEDADEALAGTDEEFEPEDSEDEVEEAEAEITDEEFLPEGEQAVRGPIAKKAKANGGTARTTKVASRGRGSGRKR
ncbi:hypothetical protein BD626DRAFT_249847 [Schizophyllum amplum]|uniref:Uncharacterized protein n=1 Tax=Schizophyllum amplum TaxID=97359 RepID=A0A550CHJ1_9AGAR|nr:hypothetical protein BD626DRAFT_249847 [Auriculariopsis ampla]